MQQHHHHFSLQINFYRQAVFAIVFRPSRSNYLVHNPTARHNKAITTLWTQAADTKKHIYKCCPYMVAPSIFPWSEPEPSVTSFRVSSSSTSCSILGLNSTYHQSSFKPSYIRLVQSLFVHHLLSNQLSIHTPFILDISSIYFFNTRSHYTVYFRSFYCCPSIVYLLSFHPY